MGLGAFKVLKYLYIHLQPQYFPTFFFKKKRVTQREDSSTFEGDSKKYEAL